jgi:acyl carrier protein
MDNRAKIIELLRGVSKKDINPDPEESLFDSGLLDSFTLQDLVSAIESTYKVKFPDREVTPRKFDTVSRIEACLESHL